MSPDTGNDGDDSEDNLDYLDGNSHAWNWCSSKLTNMLVYDFTEQGGNLGGDAREYFDPKLDESIRVNTTLLPEDSDTDSADDTALKGASGKRRQRRQSRRSSDTDNKEEEDKKFFEGLKCVIAPLTPNFTIPPIETETKDIDALAKGLANLEEMLDNAITSGKPERTIKRLKLGIDQAEKEYLKRLGVE